MGVTFHKANHGPRRAWYGLQAVANEVAEGRRVTARSVTGLRPVEASRKRATFVRRVLFGVVVLVSGSLSPMSDRVFHPEVSFFDRDHLVVGVVTALLLFIMFGALDFYLSQRQLAETMLQQREAELHEAQRVARVGSWEWVVGSDTITWSIQLRDLLRYDRARPAPTFATLGSFYVPESWARLEAAVERARSAGEPYALELEMLRTDGTSLWTMTRGEGIRDPAGQIVKLRGTVLDITERKRLEDALRANEERFRLLFDRATDGIMLLTTEGKIVAVNESFARMHGYVTTEMLGFSLKELEAPASSQDTAARMRRLLAGEALTFEVEHVKKNGHVFPLEVTTSLVLSSDGEALIQAFHRDVTERKQAEKEKAALEARLQQAQKMEAVGRLAGGVAHEFNNMLAVILGFAELSMQRMGPADKSYADIQEIQRAAQRSADLTRQLLAFARKQIVQPILLDLNGAVSHLLSMQQRLIGEHIRIKWAPGANLWPVIKDPAQLAGVLTILCLNARDAISDIGTITLATANCSIDADFCATHPYAVPGDYVRLTVGDTGCGMDAATLVRIFEPFFTTKGVGEGTGLGLASVYGAMKQNGGFITVASVVGQGTTFELYLPRQAVEASRAREPEVVAPNARGPETILVVEDEPAVLQFTTQALALQRYTVLAASSPAEALRLAREHLGDIHLLLSDVVMPEMNGRDLASAVLALRPSVRQLFMSGHTADVIASRGMLEPDVAFIEKPYTLAALTTKVRELLDGG